MNTHPYRYLCLFASIVFTSFGASLQINTQAKPDLWQRRDVANWWSVSRDHSTKQDVDEDKLAIALIRVINTSPRGFRELIAGTGRGNDGTVTYPCSMPLPGASETLIRISKDMRPYVDAKFYRGNDKSRGKEIYGDLVAKLKRILPDWHGKEEESNKESYMDFSYPSQLADESTSVTLRYVAYKESGNCTVSLTVWAPYSLTPNSAVKSEESTEWKGGLREETARGVVKQFVAHDYNGIRARFNSQ